MSEKFVIGKEEWIGLKEIGLPAVKARVDSGAKTSSLHAYNIQPFERDGKSFVRFKVHPIQDNKRIVKQCEAEVIDRRDVKNTSGQSECRHVIKTKMSLGEHEWEVEITLTNRDSMGYRMLLGREAMTGRVLVDPEQSFSVAKLKNSEAESFYQKPKRTSNALNIVLLASNPNLYSNQRIVEAGQQRGHTVRFINVGHCYLDISANNPKICYRGEEITNVDAVIPRIRPSMTFYAGAVLRQFQNAGAFILNDSISIARSRDKLRSLQMLSRQGLNMPVTGFAHSPQDTKELIRMVGGAPLVIKILESTQGRGVVLAETNKAAESVINAFKSLDANILVQEYIKEAGGKDLRCFVIDGKVVGSIERKAAAGEFRANLHLGGTAEMVKITATERKMAIKSAKIVGLKVAGVDILRSSDGPKVLEINSSPGLEGIEKATGNDLAGLMIDCIEKGVLKGASSTEI